MASMAEVRHGPHTLCVVLAIAEHDAVPFAHVCARIRCLEFLEAQNLADRDRRGGAICRIEHTRDHAPCEVSGRHVLVACGKAMC